MAWNDRFLLPPGVVLGGLPTASAPPLSPSGLATLYYDSTTNTIRTSLNGGAYADIGGGVAVAAGAGTTNRLMKFDASDDAADSVWTDDGTLLTTTTATGLGLGTTTPKTVLSFTIPAADRVIHVAGTGNNTVIIAGDTGADFGLIDSNGTANRRWLTMRLTGTTGTIARNTDAAAVGATYATFDLATDVVTLGSAGVAGVNYISGTGNHTFSDGDLLFSGANGQSQRWSRATESHTLAAAGTSTTTTAVFPASSLGKGASFRITTEITGATSVQVGVSGDATRYGTFSTLTAGQTIATSRADNYTSSTGILFTAVGGGASFTAGVIRVEVQYETATAPTS